MKETKEQIAAKEYAKQFSIRDAPIYSENVMNDSKRDFLSGIEWQKQQSVPRLGCKGKVKITYKSVSSWSEVSGERFVDCELIAIYKDDRIVVQCFDIHGNKWDEESYSHIDDFTPAETPTQEAPAAVDGKICNGLFDCTSEQIKRGECKCNKEIKASIKDAQDYLTSVSAPPAAVIVEQDWKDEYIKLLEDELNETVPIAALHGWKSSRYEKGVELRNKI